MTRLLPLELRPRALAAAGALAVALAVNCGGEPDPNGTTPPGDLSARRGDAPSAGDARPATFDAGPPDLTPQIANACGEFEPESSCNRRAYGPPMSMFPLGSDPKGNPNESDTGVDRDQNGWLGLSQSKSSFDFLWIANTGDWKVGSISKMDSRGVKEVARYFTVTCNSNPGGSRAKCDGMNGCCTRDDYARFQARQSKKPEPPHQPVQLEGNLPSRSGTDYNGDIFISNRAFGGQSSVSKIANSLSECVERNGIPGIQTSRDVNGDGIIDTDCNLDGKPDDIASVKANPCKSKLAQEFYGYDDECILFTTNTNVPDSWGRPIALGRGVADNGPSDAWAGSWRDGKFFRIDGTTGLTKEVTTVPIQPYGAIVDSAGILWTTALGGGLAYFDTANPSQAMKARDPAFPSKIPLGGYGIALDRDQNVWVGGFPYGNLYRYAPNHSGFANLGAGYWTVVVTPGGAAGAKDHVRGVAADSRGMSNFFVWAARTDGYVTRTSAADVPAAVGADNEVNGNKFAAVRVAGSETIGVGIDVDQNVWGISHIGSVLTRIKVDAAGTITPPEVKAGTENLGCPVAGDRCALDLRGEQPGPYTYSDFTGFGLRNFTNPKGSYSWVQTGCTNQESTWAKVSWQADTPPGTSITMRARTGPKPLVDDTWGPWSPNFTKSPADLKPQNALMPNPNPYLQVEFDLASNDKSTTPKLKSFELFFECGSKPQ